MTTKGTDNRFRSLTVVGESGTPSTPASGDFKLYVADDGTFYLMDDTGTTAPVGGGGFTDPMTTRGDIIYRDPSNVTARLGRGSAGYVLTSDGTDIAWAAASGGGAPTTTPYVTTAADAGLSAEVVRAWLANYFAETAAASPASQDDEFDDTSGNSGSGNGLNARWAWRNQGSAAMSYAKAGWGGLTLPAQSGNNWRIIEQTLVDGTFDCKMSFEYVKSNAIGMGLVLVDGTNGDFYVYGRSYDTGTSNTTLLIQKWTNVTTWSSNFMTLSLSDAPPQTYLRIVRASTALSFWYSPDGIGWVRLATDTDSVTATKIGLGINETNNTGTTKLWFDYFRKVA